MGYVLRVGDGQRERRLWRVALGTVALGAWVLRASPFFRHDGVLGWPVDYDEGVYTAASALLFRGQLPYRDFAFVHPPGALLALGLGTAWPLAPSAMLAAVRVAMTLVGVANVALCGALVRRHAGPVGGLAAACLLATWPEAVFAERGAFLEPLLSLWALGLAWAWCGAQPRATAAGAVAGLLLAVKSWGLVWVLAALPGAKSRTGAGRFLAAAAVVAAVLVGPFAALAPADFFSHVVLLQAQRPPDGDALFGVRFYEMFLARSPVPLLALLATASELFARRAEPVVRLAALALALLTTAFLLSPVYWNQYDAHLALPMSLAVGLGVGWRWGRVEFSAPRWARPLAFVACVALVLPALAAVLRRRLERSPEQLRRAAVLRAVPGPRACAFEAFDLLLADRLPSAVGAPPLVDSYGQMLASAAASGRRFSSAAEAFGDAAAQALVRRQLASCDVVVVGWRGAWQLDAASKAQLAADFTDAGEGVMVRRPGR